MPQSGLTGVPVVKIISIIIIYNFFICIYMEKKPIYMNFTKNRYSLKITRKNITEKGRKKSDRAVLSN